MKRVVAECAAHVALNMLSNRTRVLITSRALGSSPGLQNTERRLLMFHLAEAEETQRCPTETEPGS